MPNHESLHRVDGGHITIMVSGKSTENHQTGEDFLGSVLDGCRQPVKGTFHYSLLALFQGTPCSEQPDLFRVLCKFALAWQNAGGVRDLINQCGRPFT